MYLFKKKRYNEELKCKKEKWGVLNKNRVHLTQISVNSNCLELLDKQHNDGENWMKSHRNDVVSRVTTPRPFLLPRKKGNERTNTTLHSLILNSNQFPQNRTHFASHHNSKGIIPQHMLPVFVLVFFTFTMLAFVLYSWA